MKKEIFGMMLVFCILAVGFSAAFGMTNSNVINSPISGGVSTGNDGYAGDMGHPHNQDVNSTSSFDSVDLGVEDYIHHVGDLDTLINFFIDRTNFICGNIEFLEFTETTQDTIVFNEDSNDIDFRIESDVDTNAFFVRGDTSNIGLGLNTPTRHLEIYDLTDNCYFEMDTDKANGMCGFLGYNDAQDWFFYMPDSVDNIRIRDNTYGLNPITIEPNSHEDCIYIDDDQQINMFSNTGTNGKEVDLNGDHEATSYNPVSDRRCKNIKYDLKELNDSLVLKLLRNIDIYIFQWKDPNFYDDNNTRIEWNSEGYGISSIAQWLYYDILNNFTGNPQLNLKVANALVSVGTENTQWSINKDNIMHLVLRGFQINDERITILEEKVFR